MEEASIMNIRTKYRGTMAATALAAGLALGAPAAFAQDARALETRALAATCANCHGTDGNVVPDAGMPSLRGMTKERLMSLLDGFAKGTRPATVMHQLVKGYTPAQLDQITTYIAAQR